MKIDINALIAKLKGIKKETFASAKLQDGTEITADPGFEVGASTNAPDGEHMLDNGMKITCAAGKITAVESVGAPDEMQQLAQVVGQQFASQLKPLEQQFADHKKSVEDLTAKLKTSEDARAKDAETIKELTAFKEKFAAHFAALDEMVNAATEEEGKGGKGKKQTEQKFASDKAGRIAQLAAERRAKKGGDNDDDED